MQTVEKILTIAAAVAAIVSAVLTGQQTFGRAFNPPPAAGVSVIEPCSLQ